MRTAIKRARLAIAAGEAAPAREAVRVAESHIRSAVTKGVYHPKTGSRYISRLATQAAKLG